MDEAEKRARNRERMKGVYWWRKEHGICIKCGKEDARPGRVTCLACGFPPTPERSEQYLERNAERNKTRRQERIEAGLCPRCGKPAYPGHKQCYSCMLKARRIMRECRERKGKLKHWREAGLCVRCGGECVEGRTVCAECLEKLRAHAKQHLHGGGNAVCGAGVDTFWRAHRKNGER